MAFTVCSFDNLQSGISGIQRALTHIEAKKMRAFAAMLPQIDFPNLKEARERERESRC
jgi:hypothetical protein